MNMPSSTSAVLTIFFFLLPQILSLQSPPPPSKSTHSPPPASSSGLSTGILSVLESTLTQIQQVNAIVSHFPGGIIGADLRLSSAISDCLDLLDFSSDELSLTISADPGTGDHRSDFRSWLSAALGNQDTCKESLSSTGSPLASLASAGLDGITTLLQSGLQQLPAGGKLGPGRKLAGGFPNWVTAGERRLLQAAAVTADVVVAKDGSGNYTTVTEAVEAAPEKTGRRFVIYVKRGVYVENVEIKKKKWNVVMFGDGMSETVISGSRSFVDGWTTFRSATFAAAGKGFIARDITFENTAGAAKHQAVAFRSDSDLSVYYRCGFRGYQDTLYAHSLRQFYRECRISGTVDYVFGNAAAVFQNCQLLSRLPLPNQKNTITAQGRKDLNQNTGFVLQFCNITADTDLAASGGTAVQSYLGRPWKEYSKTIILQSYIGSSIRSEGWLPWNGDFALSTLYYAEYMNFGPGSGLGGRVNWTGYHVITSSAQAAGFTVSQFIDGNLWLPSTGIKYTAGDRKSVV